MNISDALVPKVTIVIPNYNRASTVLRSIRAALIQTVAADEIIIIDDGSTDGSKAIIADFCSGRSEIRFIDREFNIGLMPTLNEGLNLATGDIVYFGASDDQILDTACECAKRLFGTHPEAGVMCGHAVARVDETKTVFDQALCWADEDRYFSADDWVEVMTYACPLSHSIFYNREKLLSIGGFRNELKWHADWFSQHTLGFLHGAIYTKEALSIRLLEEESYGEAGIRSRNGQREVLTKALLLLREEPFSSVRMHFALSGTFAQFGVHALRVVFEINEFSSLEDFKLVSFALAREMMLKQQDFFRKNSVRLAGLAGSRERTAAMSEGEVLALVKEYPFRGDVCRLAAKMVRDESQSFRLLQRAHRINPFDESVIEDLRNHPMRDQVTIFEG